MSADLFTTQNINEFIETDKATQVMLRLLLSQYKTSTNLQEYMLCFVKELDLLFEQIDRTLLGRYLSFAQGKQLDVIGEILQQKRGVILPKIWFGFQGAVNIAKMADEAKPSDGGIFRSEDIEGFSITPLTDFQYRNLLRVKALCHTNKGYGVNFIYYVTQVLLNKTPSLLKISEPTNRQVLLEVHEDQVSTEDLSLILYASRYFIPSGIGFSANRVAPSP